MEQLAPDFHDGYFVGLLIEDTFVRIFLDTVHQERFAVSASGVVRLRATEILQGNIIAEALLWRSSEITLDQITEVYDLPKKDPVFAGKDKRENLLDSAKKKNLCLLEIRPSYGATCLVLAESFTVKPD